MATFSYILHGLVIWSIQGSVTDVIALNKFGPLSCSAGQKSDACLSISKDSPFYLHNGKWDYQFQDESIKKQYLLDIWISLFIFSSFYKTVVVGPIVYIYNID